jgi:hypothetical protein
MGWNYKEANNLRVGDKLLQKRTKEVCEIKSILVDDTTFKTSRVDDTFMFYGFNVKRKALSRLFEVNTTGELKVIIEG